jgi:hypothetical protein
MVQLSVLPSEHARAHERLGCPPLQSAWEASSCSMKKIGANPWCSHVAGPPARCATASVLLTGAEGVVAAKEEIRLVR